VLVAVALASLVAACGKSSDDPELSHSKASSMRADLNRISQSVRDGNCTTAQQVTAKLQSEIDGLSSSVSAKLRRALSSSAQRLDTLVRDQCKPATEAAPVVTTPEPSQETDQTDGGNQENKDKSNKDKKAKKEKSKDVPPGQDGGDGTTPPGQQDGDQSPGDTGGASPQGG
jgi:hypothetical protein